MPVHPSRPGTAIALAALVACTGSPAPASRSVAVEPLPGERHLRNVRQLTFGGNNAEAYFSPDGRRLIFQRQEDTEAGCDQQYVMNADGSGMRRVSNGLGRTTCGYFHDRGRRILYSSTFEHSPQCPPAPDRSQGYVWPLGHFEIYSARADGSDLRRLTRNDAYDAEATVSPDGRRVVFTSTRDGDFELYLVNVDGSGLERVTTSPEFDGFPMFSPDGERLVFASNRNAARPGETNIFIADWVE